MKLEIALYFYRAQSQIGSQYKVRVVKMNTLFSMLNSQMKIYNRYNRINIQNIIFLSEFEALVPDRSQNKKSESSDIVNAFTGIGVLTKNHRI